jgi:hypothetical protein
MAVGFRWNKPPVPSLPFTTKEAWMAERDRDGRPTMNSQKSRGLWIVGLVLLALVVVLALWGFSGAGPVP